MLTSSLCLYKPANGTGSELSLTVLLSVLNYHGEALIRLGSFSIFHFPLDHFKCSLRAFGYLLSRFVIPMKKILMLHHLMSFCYNSQLISTRNGTFRGRMLQESCPPAHLIEGCESRAESQDPGGPGSLVSGSSKQSQC